MGELLTRWSVRLAVACYLGRVGVEAHAAATGSASQAARQARWLWTLGGLLYALHVLFAFHFYHHWSHRLAWEDTADQTAAVVGIAWGGGLYVNYAFTLFWLADLVAWWSRGVQWPYRSRAYFWMVHGVFAFIVFNATVVFGASWWRLAAVIAAAAMLTARFRLGTRP